MAKRQFVRKMKGHFYAASIAEWRTNEDQEKLINAMKAGGFNFSIIFVPLPADANYEIRDYVPQVPGCVLISEYFIEK